MNQKLFDYFYGMYDVALTASEWQDIKWKAIDDMDLEERIDAVIAHPDVAGFSVKMREDEIPK